MNFLPVEFFSGFWANAAAWAAVAAVIPAIILLYFLKLKRHPVEVPSTYLWTRTIEDLHVNSIWQRLRQNLLLFLQILLVLLVLWALLRPGWRGSRSLGQRYIVLMDVSASMNATDESPSRLEAARARAEEVIDGMGSGDVAMILSFSDTARVEQSFTENRTMLRNRLRQIGPTSRATDMTEALRAAAGLANPGSTSQDEQDVQVAEPLPATVFILSDGGFPPVSDFALGNLTPQYIPVGSAAPDNVGIVAFTTRRNIERPGQAQAFARLANYGVDSVTVDVELLVNGESRDVQRVEVPAGEQVSVDFDLSDIDAGERTALELVLDRDDALALDNVAYAALNLPRPARVLLVTPSNNALKAALGTEEAIKLANTTVVEPALLQTQRYQADAAAGVYDLIIYDRCLPPTMPQANTLFIGVVPLLDTWSAGPPQGPPVITDIDQVYPLMQLLDLRDVNIIEAVPLHGGVDPQNGQSRERPPGGSVLIDSDIGPLMIVAPREGFEDAVLGFELFGTNADGQTVRNTDWHLRRSFPVFVLNVVSYLGGGRAAVEGVSVRPGDSIALRSTLPVEKVVVEDPEGNRVEVAREAQNTFVYTRTDRPGIYRVYEVAGDEPSQLFAVNLFDSEESNLVPRGEVQLGYSTIEAASDWQPARTEAWKWLLLLGVGVMMIEWYIYHRRVYL